MNGTQLAALSGVVLSLIFSYAPGVKDWYGKQDGQTKSLVMLGCLALVAVGAYGLSCANWWPSVTCDEAGIKALVEAFIAALVSNQATYVITPAKQP